MSKKYELLQIILVSRILPLCLVVIICMQFVILLGFNHILIQALKMTSLKMSQS